MSAPQRIRPEHHDLIAAAVERACATIAPTWPLDRFIAVNPYWGRIGQSFEDAGRALERIAGSRLQMPLAYYRALRADGTIGTEHLAQALAERGEQADLPAWFAAQPAEEPAPAPMPLPSDAIDAMRGTAHAPAWRDAIMQQLTQFCAAFFDRDQADWHPGAGEGLYASWREAMVHDHTIALLMRAPEVRARARSLPADAWGAIRRAAEQFGMSGSRLEEFFEVALARIGGWAAWCGYQRWQARLAGGDDGQIVELLAMRLAWECLLDDGSREADSPWARWQAAWAARNLAAVSTAARARETWQRAHEIARQREFARLLSRRPAAGPGADAAFQAVFCIDVRSEVFRRALEASEPHAQTLGFAGFFGLPVSYTPIGTRAERPQLPGLLAPALGISEASGSGARDLTLAELRRSRLGVNAVRRPFARLPASAFALVETLGLGYLGALVRRSLPSRARGAAVAHPGLRAREAAMLRPRLAFPAATPIAEQATLAERVLRAMSLVRDFAPIVLLAGHGSRSANNPHAAGLDCGACCGQTGEVNARALALLLNDPAVREELIGRGIAVPATTHFLAGLHDTTTDTVDLFDRDLVPDGLAPALARLEAALAAAGQRARAERAPALGLGAIAGDAPALERAIRERANDWAQTRPEWGLANCAAFVVGPRARTRGVDLGGRSFLHDYDHRADTDRSVLELIMTAPMVVTHWINMQYHASTVDNPRYGSGNKVLHNVVGGRIGVFEGNAGDLRIGLPMQSVHDGARWMHEPLRLSVFIEAPREAIDGVIAKHALVRQLVEHRWLYLFRTEDDLVEALGDDGWKACARDGAAAA